MNTSLMRFSARRALEEGNITQKKYSQIIAHIEQLEKQKITSDEKMVNEVSKNLLKSMA